MKRGPELTPLSHDHHKALFVAQRLKRADDPEAAVAAFLEFWHSQGSRHFVIEEEVLLPSWLECDRGADLDAAHRVQREHLTIRARARELEHGARELGRLHELGALLERHVRFEERELFPSIEAGLEPEALSRLGEEIAAAEAVPPAGGES